MVGVRSGRVESEHVAIMQLDDIWEGKAWMLEIYAIRKRKVEMGMKVDIRMKAIIITTMGDRSSQSGPDFKTCI